MKPTLSLNDGVLHVAPFISNRIVKLCMAIAVFLFSAPAFAQLVGDETVKANFGVDGDIYSNQLQFGSFPVPASGTDDWFYKGLGSGLGVIDTTGAAALNTLFSTANLAGRNIEVERRMSRPINSINNGKRWLDAVYGRDNNSTGSNSDLSVFTGGSDKNFFNPKKWTIGSGGSPQKNDLIEVFAHLRRDGEGLFDTLWGYGGASVIVENGNSHVDFEYFRETFEFIDGAGVFTTLGLDSGHTAWRFD